MYGCSGKPVDKSPTVIKIDNIVITSNEYDEAVKESQYASSDTLEARKEFLEHYLTKLLILREAERVGADKDPEFLKNVQLFWQQSLVKMMLDRKIKEIVSHVGVDDSEIKDYYFANKNSEFKDRELPAVYDDIKWMILNKKQSALLEDWLGSLRQASKIDINYKLLKIEE
jgi:hypothetical protein